VYQRMGAELGEQMTSSEPQLMIKASSGPELLPACASKHPVPLGPSPPQGQADPPRTLQQAWASGTGPLLAYQGHSTSLPQRQHFPPLLSRPLTRAGRTAGAPGAPGGGGSGRGKGDGGQRREAVFEEYSQNEGSCTPQSVHALTP